MIRAKMYAAALLRYSWSGRSGRFPHMCYSKPDEGDQRKDRLNSGRQGPVPDEHSDPCSK